MSVIPSDTAWQKIKDHFSQNPGGLRETPSRSDSFFDQAPTFVKLLNSHVSSGLCCFYTGIEQSWDGDKFHDITEGGLEFGEELVNEDNLLLTPFQLQSLDSDSLIPDDTIVLAYPIESTDPESEDQIRYMFTANGGTTVVGTTGSNVGSASPGFTDLIRFSNDIFNGFNYDEPDNCSSRGGGDCSQYILDTDRVYLVMEDAAGAGDHVRLWAEIRDLPVTAAVDVKESIEEDVDGKLHLVGDLLNPNGCGYYGVGNAGGGAAKTWFEFEDLFEISSPPGSIDITNNACVFDWQLDGDEETPTDCSFYGKIGGSRGWHLFEDIVKNSIEIDDCHFQLVGDQDAPGDKFYYGTSGGVKGFHALDDAGSVITEKSITGDGTSGDEIHLVNDETAVGEWNYYGTSTVGPGGLAWRPLTDRAKHSIEFDLGGDPGFHFINDDSGPADGTLYCAFSGSGQADHRGWHTIEQILQDVTLYSDSVKQMLWHSQAGGVEWVQTSTIAQNSIEMDATFEVLQLVNDVDGPGNDFFYGTDDAGVKGWFAITHAVETKNSIIGDGASGTELELDGDVSSPGDGYIYGQIGSSKGWFHISTYLKEVSAYNAGELQILSNNNGTIEYADTTDCGV